MRRIDLRDGLGSTAPKPKRPQRVVLLTSGTTGTPKGAPRDIDITLAAPGGFVLQHYFGYFKTCFEAPVQQVAGSFDGERQVDLGFALPLRALLHHKAAADGIVGARYGMPVVQKRLEGYRVGVKGQLFVV